MAESAAVALVRCGSYDDSEVSRAVGTAIELIGGWGAFLKPEEKILLKPNLLRGAAPENAVTTHPSILKAVADLLREGGFAHLSYGDSPGRLSMKSVARTAGLAKVAGDVGLPEADFKHSSTVSYEGTNFTICRGVLEADAIVSLPKMKTHALERITGAVKNTYGCIHGIHKVAGHTRYPDSKSFGAMLAKLERGVKPRLYIMDGVVAMEGNGPASGDPINMNVILASGDPYALDEVFCRLIALNPALVPTNTHAPDRDVVIRTPQGEISWLDAFRQYGAKDFRVDRSVDAGGDGGSDSRLSKAMQQRPVIQKDLCQSCKVCVESCPLSGKALSMKGDYPVYDYDQCIRCYCCQEMCPHGAISVSRP